MRSLNASLIFTSATLKTGSHFHWFTDAMGLGNARMESWNSPYDWENQSKDCEVQYTGGSAMYSTQKPIYKRSWQGEVINCTPIETISGLVNLEAKRSGSQLRFENKFKQLYPTKP
jgi:hypothetical protein